jgi:hypothetical protein
VNTILVLQLHKCPLHDIGRYLEDVGPAEFTGHGFREVLIADHSELDAYRSVELFGLLPALVRFAQHGHKLHRPVDPRERDHLLGVAAPENTSLD